MWRNIRGRPEAPQAMRRNLIARAAGDVAGLQTRMPQAPALPLPARLPPSASAARNKYGKQALHQVSMRVYFMES